MIARVELMTPKKTTHISIYLSYLLRHNPSDAGLDMDHHGWVNVNQLITNVNATGRYHLSAEELTSIVETEPVRAEGNRIQGSAMPLNVPYTESASLAVRPDCCRQSVIEAASTM